MTRRSQTRGTVSQQRELFLYVIKCEDDCFYVGITQSAKRRLLQHELGSAAAWTQEHPPIDVVQIRGVGTHDRQIAERVENRLTLEMMARYGWRQVRGGYFCNVCEVLTERAMRHHCVFDEINKFYLDQPRPPADLEAGLSRASRLEHETEWGRGVETFVAQATVYYDSAYDVKYRAPVVEALANLARSSHWYGVYASARSPNFYGRQGLLPVLLSFQRNRPTGFKFDDCYSVLDAALQRTRNGQRQHAVLYIMAAAEYGVPLTATQLLRIQVTSDRIDQSLNLLEPTYVRDTQYDAFLSILFPELADALHLSGRPADQQAALTSACTRFARSRA
jgi:predicted GIY-YIG superfamily endonuclease